MTALRRRRRPLPLDLPEDGLRSELEYGALFTNPSLFVIGFYVGLGFLCAQLLFGFFALILFLALIA